MAENNYNLSEYPSVFDEEIASDYNEMLLPQRVNFYYQGTLVFHHILTYNEFGILIRNQIIKDI